MSLEQMFSNGDSYFLWEINKIIKKQKNNWFVWVGLGRNYSAGASKIVFFYIF